jgi:hypothetical protein
MIKKLLFTLTVLMVSAVSFAQFDNISILGGSTTVGWNSDIDMVTTDGVVYTYNNLVITVPASDPGVKFRKGHDWTVNWGGSGFPAGTASLNGSNIPAVNGTYNVTFNLSTLQYSFVAAGFDDVTVEGIHMFTTDGINYSVNNVALNGQVTFNVNAVPVPVSAEVSENNYNVTFNKQTGAYAFNFVVVSLIGEGVADWNTDTDLTTTDGFNYTLRNFTFPGGEAKFRLNHDYNPGWGGTEFPAGTGSTAGDAPNIPITAGTYDVAFNRLTGVYSFSAPTAGTQSFAVTTFTVYPNPSQNSWNFTSSASNITNLQVIDVTGKVIYTAVPNALEASVEASGLTAGIYFARVSSANAVQTIKLIRK